MQSEDVSRSDSSNTSQSQQSTVRRLNCCSQIKTGGGQQVSPVVYPEKRRKKAKSSSRKNDGTDHSSSEKSRNEDVVIDVVDSYGVKGGDEKSDLLGWIVHSGKLVFDKKKATASDNTDSKHSKNGSNDISSKQAIDAQLTSKDFVWGTNKLNLNDVVSVSYNAGVKHFTVHSYPIKEPSCCVSCFVKPKRRRRDYRFVSATIEEAVQWVGGFADQQCYVNCLPHPLASSKKQGSSELLPTDVPSELLFKCKLAPKLLVILNPQSGRGRSSKVFHATVEPIFKLAGFQLEVVKTTSAGHARKLASTVEINRCPDGIICIGGDGIVNEVLNGLLSRENQKEGISIPIGIIPAGSDNSLVWTVLGVRDPVSAALAIVKGGLTATDVFAVEWIQTGVLHFGMTVSYYGFVSDVLQQSGKYQKGFGPLRYFVAGFFKFLCLPKYSYEVEYLAATKESVEIKRSPDQHVVEISELCTETVRSSGERIPRASSLSSIDSILSPSHVSTREEDATSSGIHAGTEPSEYVRGLDPKTKQLSFGRSNEHSEPEVVHPQLPLSTTPHWPRTRSRSRADKGWSGLTTIHDPSRCSWANTATNDREDISSTLSDPGPIWDAEPKWDMDPNWEPESPIELPDNFGAEEHDIVKEQPPRIEAKWEFRKGSFLGIMVCNHACRTVQSSQVVAPLAEHDDGMLDLILVHGGGRLRLLRFFVLLQMGRHLSLPYVEYIKVRSVKIKAGKHTHDGCGIDGEFFPLNGQAIASILPEQCRLIGRPPNHHLHLNAPI